MGTQAELGVDDEDDLPWITLCEEHSELCSHPNKRYAERWAAWPEWCSGCRVIMADKGL
jgi:hypothetical protein